MSIEGDSIKNIENQVEDKPDKSAMADSETSQDTKEDAQNNTETEEEIKNDENEKEDDNDSVKSEKDESNGKVESENDEKDEETSPKEKPKVEKEKSKVVEKKKSAKTENNKSEKSEGEEDEDEEEEENDDEDNEDKEDEDEEEDDSKPKPGARDRKRVQRFNEDLPEIKEKYEGSGVQLGNITAIDINLSRTKADDLKPLHKLLFKNPGKLNMIKKNIRKFNGFDFTADSEAYTAKVAILNKLEPIQLRSMCSFLDLDKKGSKEELSTKICDYLLCPKDTSIKEDPIDSSQSGRPRRSAAVKAASRRYSDSEDSEDKSPRKRGKGQRATLKDDSSSESDYNPSGSEGSDVGKVRKRPATWKGGRAKTKRTTAVSDQSASPDDDSEEDSDREPPKQRARPGRPQARSAKPAAKKTPAKRGAPAKGSEPSDSEEDAADSDEEPKKKKGRVVVNNKAKNSPANNQKGKKAAPPPAAKGRPQRAATSKPTKHDSSSGSEEESEAESEDEPLVAKTSPKKKSKTQEPPTDADLKTLVKEILDGANLEEITMKTVCKQVYAKYPQFDLAHKKDFIKSTVKSLIST